MKRFLFSILILAVITGGGIAVWLTLDQRAKAERLEAEILKGLTAEEIAAVLKSEAAADRNAIEGLKESAEKRRLFLKGIRETLALAAQARREGFAEKENFRINFEYKKDILLADLYLAKLSEGKDRLYVVPPDEIEAVWKDPNNEQRFAQDMRVMREIRQNAEKAQGKDGKIPELAGESLDKARGRWARTKILSKQARADREFMNQPAIPLRLKILEAGILANDLVNANFAEHLKVNEREIARYVTDHPEYSIQNKLKKAEEVLTKAKAGEDFEKLAKEYSEDRMSNERGGLYEDAATNVLWKEVEDAALKLEVGEIAENLIESDLGFHIVKLVKKNDFKKSDRSDLKFSVRHIVLQKKFEEPNTNIPGVPPPFLTAEEIARAEIGKAKRAKFIALVAGQNPVSLPEDFAVELPEIRKAE